jgi:uncharacterized membrane protein YuzA (DUF378 family)
MPGCGGKRNAVVINCEKSTYISGINWLILGIFFRNIPSKLLYLSLTLDPLHNTCDTVWALSSFCGNVVNLLIFAFPSTGMAGLYGIGPAQMHCSAYTKRSSAGV